MEMLSQLWQFAPALQLKLVYLAMVAQMLVAIYCYLTMSKGRVSAAKSKRVSPEIYKATDNEPEDLRVLTRAVANQFELPVLFYAVVLAAISASAVNWITVVLAWLFVVLRFIHSREMMTSNRVLLRRKMFIRALQVFLLLVAQFVITLLFFV